MTPTWSLQTASGPWKECRMSHSSSTTGSIMAELASLLAAGLFLLGMGGSMLKNAASQTRIYTPD